VAQEIASSEMEGLLEASTAAIATADDLQLSGIQRSRGESAAHRQLIEVARSVQAGRSTVRSRLAPL